MTGTGGSLLAAISKLVDVYLQPLAEFSSCYIRNWEHLMELTEDLGKLPAGAKLFTADATSMYTNIDIDHGLAVLRLWLDKLKEEGKIALDYPIKLIMELTEIVMKTNHFRFGDTDWLQLVGTAMGTPMACIYATIYFAWKEMTNIIPQFQAQLPLLTRFIDNIMGVWNPVGPSSFDEFSESLQQYGPGMLKWDVSNLKDEVIMLDLRVRIQDGTLKTTTFQKELNLYAYVPHHSAHLPGFLHTLVISQLTRYYKQCSAVADYEHLFACLFLKRLMNRGYKYNDIKPFFCKAARRLDDRNYRTTTKLLPLPNEEDWHPPRRSSTSSSTPEASPIPTSTALSTKHADSVEVVEDKD